jgi:hypothetical protein
MARTKRTYLTGPELETLLKAGGVDVQKVTRNKQTGNYTLTFQDPNHDNFYSKGLKTAQELARDVEQVIPQADIYDESTAHATWRPHNPIHSVLLFVRLPSGMKQ